MTKIDEKMLECAMTLKEYCKGFNRDCTGCLFDTDDDVCILISFVPQDWGLDALSKTKAVELLKEMRYKALNATQYDDRNREVKAEALKMAIEALEG